MREKTIAAAKQTDAKHAAALQGETLEVLGVKSGRIQEVFGFEPVQIAVNAERVDVMVRDDAGALYHLEEQRN